MREAAVIRRGRERGRHAVQQFLRDLVDEPRRLARLILAEHATARGAGEHEALPRAGHADITEPSFFLELLLVLARSRVWKQALFKPGEDHRRELEALCAVEGHQPDARIARALLFVNIG